MEGKVLFYEGKYYMLSNFSAFAVWFGGEWYPTAEHLYQAEKFTDSDIRMTIRSCKSPEMAKIMSLAHKSHRRTDWDEKVKLEVMEYILRRKLQMHDSVRYALLQSGDMEIVENSPTDSFWGWGPDKQGQNHLGKIWMKLRDELKLQTGIGVV